MNFTKFAVLHPLKSIFTRHYAQGPKAIVCEKDVRPIIVTIIGGNSRVGKLVALLLKQCPLVDELRLFDTAPGLCGSALDLSHIDTNVKVKSYTGLQMLRPAILNSKVIAICGGEAMKPGHPEYELFCCNADYVRNVALHSAEFNRNAILCIATPPIAAMVPLASEEYKKAKVYDARRILGVTALAVMRGNSIIANYVEEDPTSIMCPIVGAIGVSTTVAVVSQTKPGDGLPSPITDVLRNRIARAEEEVLNLKYIENAGPCTVSSAFATSRFITSVIRGMLDIFVGVECAFVRQTGHVGSFLPYMASLVKLGRYGVESIHMPCLDAFECTHLERASHTIRKQIDWGESYITGQPLRKRRRCKKPIPSCPLVQVKRVTRIGDVDVDSKLDVVQGEELRSIQ